VDDPASPFVHWDVEVNRYPAHTRLPGEYLPVLVPLVTVILTRTPPGQGEVTVYHEDYARRKLSSSETTLKELGGLFKTLVQVSGHAALRLRLQAVPIPSWKVAFTHKGGASKTDIQKAWRDRYRLPDLRPPVMLRYQPKASWPHPVEDLADALGVAVGGLAPSTVVKGSQTTAGSTTGKRKAARAYSKPRPKSKKKLKIGCVQSLCTN